jgi:hypothetical protein
LDGDASLVDTRTRLYYTAKFSDNFMFVNKFEMDAAWGAQDSYGDIGADGVNVEVKNSYADFTLDPVNFKVGVQGGILGRSFLFDEDFAGVVVTYEGEAVSIPIYWMRAYEGGNDDMTQDADYFAIDPTFTLADMLDVNPYFMYIHSDNGSDFFSDAEVGERLFPEDPAVAAFFNSVIDDVDLYYVGLDLDAKLDFGTLWFTGIYQGGELEDLDVSAYLAAVGGTFDLGPANIHAEGFYASGDAGRDPDDDSDLNTYFVPEGQSYYWAEIMGLGEFDARTANGFTQSAGSPGDAIGNIWAVNLGGTVMPTEKLSCTLDLWYAQLVEENAFDEDELGFEVDLKLNYKLMENLDLMVVGAYLFADDATINPTATGEDTNEDDPWEVGTALTLKF